MATLFFEGFNLQNTDNTPYLDNRYWTRPIDPNTPKVAYELYGQNIDTTVDGTQGALRISGYRLDSNPPQQPTFVQLSGVSGLNSNQIYLSFRVEGLGHNDLFNNSFPFACKLFTLCNGDSESLVFETVRTSGASIQGGSQWYHANSGLGISVKQSGNQIGLFDLRLGDISSYNILDPRVYTFSQYANASLTTVTSFNSPRLMHLEFLIDRVTQIVNFKLDGFDVLNRLIFPYNTNASGNYAFDTIDNIKFYNRGIVTASENNSNYGTNNGVLTIDDLAICNNSGNNPNTWMGPKTRIWLLSDNLYFGSNVVNKQDWSIGAGSYSTAIDSSNGDNSYIFSDTSGSISAAPLKTNGSEMFSSNFPNYFNNGIGGIRLYNDVRKTFLDSNFVNVYATGTGLANNNVYSEIGPSYTVQNSTYNIKNSFIFNNPATNTPWTSGTFFIFNNGISSLQTSGYFGIKKL